MMRVCVAGTMRVPGSLRGERDRKRGAAVMKNQTNGRRTSSLKNGNEHKKGRGGGGDSSSVGGRKVACDIHEVLALLGRTEQRQGQRTLVLL